MPFELHREGYRDALERTSTLDYALLKAQSLSKSMISRVVIFDVERTTRTARACADNGQIVWLRACPSCKCDGSYCTKCFAKGYVDA
jgi:hypothetical protein